MNDIAQQSLANVPQVDWDNYGKTSSAPPPALDEAGKPIVYYGVAETAVEGQPIEPGSYLNYTLDPIVITSDGPGKGYQLRFSRASAKPYNLPNGQPKKGNPNRLSDFLRATGLQAKPTTADQFRACVGQVVSTKKQFAFTIDWYAKNKQTGEVVKGFNAFPIDPTTGRRKWVLKAGDVVQVLDSKGNPTGQTETITSDTIFANAELKFFRDPKGGK